MKKSWKTSLFGIAGSLMVGCSEAPGIPPWLSHVLLKLAIAAPAIGLLFARDNNKTSEQVGAHKNGHVTVIVPSDPSNPQTG